MASPLNNVQMPCRVKGQATCIHHIGKELELYCKQCETLACKGCLSTVHDSHALRDLCEIIPETKQHIHSFVDKAEKEDLVEIGKYVTSIDQQLKENSDSFDKLSHKIITQNNRLKEELDLLTAQTLSHYKQIEEDNVKLLQTYKHDLEKCYTELTQLVRGCKEALQSGSNIDIHDAEREIRFVNNLPLEPLLCTASFSPNKDPRVDLHKAMGEFMMCICSKDEAISPEDHIWSVPIEQPVQPPRLESNKRSRDSYGSTHNPGHGSTINHGHGSAVNSGHGSTDNPGHGPTDNPGRGSTGNPGHGSTDKPGYDSTDNPGHGSTDNPWHGSTSNPGHGPTNNSGHGPTNNSGHGSTENPGHGSTDNTEPGSTNNPGHGSTINHGHGSAVNPVHDPTDNPGHGSTDNPGHGSTYNSGHGSTVNPGRCSTDNPGHGPTDNPGHGSTDNPGRGSTDNPGHGSTDNPGHDSTDNPGHGPTNNPGHGTTNNPEHGPTNNPGHGPTNNPGHGFTDNQCVLEKKVYGPTLLPQTKMLAEWKSRCSISAICPTDDGLLWSSYGFSQTLTLQDRQGTVKHNIPHRIINDMCTSPATNTIWVCDEENNVMELVSGQLEYRFDTERRPRCICITSNNHVVVGMTNHVSKFTTDGKPVLTTLTGENVKPLVCTPLRVTECPLTRNLAVAHRNNNTDGEEYSKHIVVIDEEFNELFVYDGKIPVAYYQASMTRNEPFDPRDVAYDKMGNLVIGDHDNRRLLLISGFGDFLRILHTDNNGTVAVSMDKENILWAIFGLHNVKRLQYYTT